MWRPFLLAVFSLLAAFPALSADRVISQTVDTSTARVQPAAIGFFRGESVAYTVTPRLGSAAITVSTNATATWTVCPQTSTTTAVLEVSGAVATNGVCVFASPIASNTMAAGAYDSFVRIQDGATLVTASRSTLYVYKSPYPDSPSVVPYSFAEPLWMSASNRVVYSNQMGSGATWTGTNWTFASSGTSENFATNAAFIAVSNTASLGVTNVTGGILSLIGRQISLVTSNITAVLDSVYAAIVHEHPYTAVTNAPWVSTELDPSWTAASGGVAYASDLATYPALTDTVALAGSAWQNSLDATNWQWRMSSDYLVEVTNYTGPASVFIPSTLDGYPVVGVGANCFRSNSVITSVSGGEFVNTIGMRAFQGCANLTAVNTAERIRFINSDAFNGCTALVSFPINPIWTIGNRAFKDCSNLLTFATSSDFAPTENNDVFLNTPVTINVYSPVAVYSNTFNGRPVVRLPLYGSGSALTGITAGQVGAVSNNAAGIAAAGGLTNIPAVITPVTLAVGDGNTSTVESVFYYSLGTLTTNVTVVVGASMTNTAQARGFWLDWNSATFSITFPTTMFSNVTGAAVSSNTAYSSYWHAGVGQTIFKGAWR